VEIVRFVGWIVGPALFGYIVQRDRIICVDRSATVGGLQIEHQPFRKVAIVGIRAGDCLPKVRLLINAS
jgi:hypothetical protein